MSELCILLVLLSLASLLFAHHASAQPPTTPTYFAEVCLSENGNYTTNSAYESNLNSVLFILSLEANNTESSFNSSAGTLRDMVYGQYYCRGDISTQLCGDCISSAAQSVRENCPKAKAAVMYYEECTLRYANQSMVGVEAEDSGYHLWGLTNVTDPDNFGAVLNETRDKVVETASYGNGSLHFATGEGVVSESETVYLLAQCSPDLNETQCDTCLGSASEVLSMSKSAGYWPEFVMDFKPSCQIRYSMRAFYSLPNTTASVSPAPSSYPPQTSAVTDSSINLTPPSTSPAAAANQGKNLTYYVIRAAVAAAIVGLVILLGVFFCSIKRKRGLSSNSQHLATVTTVDDVEESEVQNIECVQFDLKTMMSATNNFSIINKLGQGGFGIVYQGMLEDGQDIAVKRLSKNSGQGSKEFKTEVAVVAKLQHKNLVRLVGCCVDREERLLVYEFLRNLSLDRFLYDPTRSAFLTWTIRHKIIQGIARGLHYLHEDSRVKIVHRDLKTSNILLDDNLEPKIADFGLAKLVKVDQTSDNTTKVVGTYGYMSPEYALAGRYSTKSDVYSFGVIVLEILSGKINNQFYEISHGEGLLSYAWRIWNEGAIEKLLDPILQNNYSRIEAKRCLQIGLLCVQDDEANRPPMHAVVVMLNTNSFDLPPPLSPSHSSYINKLSLGDETQKGTRKQHQNDSTTSTTLSPTEKDLYAR